MGAVDGPAGAARDPGHGLLVGALRAGIASRSVTSQSLVPFLAGLLLMGFALSALQLGRFVSAEVHPPLERGRAIP